MQKDTFTRMPIMFLMPKRYFKETIADRTFTLKDVVYVSLFSILILTILQVLSFGGFYGLQAILLIGFVLGLIVSYAFRTYFLTAVLNKMGHAVDFKRVGMIVGLASFVHVLIYIFALIFQSYEYAEIFLIIRRVWNLLVIIIGLLSLRNMRVVSSIVAVLAMFGFESLFIFVFSGVFQF